MDNIQFERLIRVEADAEAMRLRQDDAVRLLEEISDQLRKSGEEFADFRASLKQLVSGLGESVRDLGSSLRDHSSESVLRHEKLRSDVEVRLGAIERAYATQLGGAQVNRLLITSIVAPLVVATVAFLAAHMTR